MRPSLLISAGLVAATLMLGSNASATWQYDPVYGGLTQYGTPQSQSPTVTITHNGIGRHPTSLSNETVTYGFQDNVAGQRAMRTRTAIDSGNSTVSHFVFGGLNSMVEFDEDPGEVHYTVGEMYVTVDNNDNTVQTQYAVRDRLQSTRALLASDKTVSAQFGYDTLGKPTENDQACKDSDCSPAHRYPYRFQSHQYLAWNTSTGGYQPGVTDNKDRFYSHDQGLRFMHTDLANASISPYTAYADDSINLIDWTGFVTRSWKALLSLLNRTQVVWIAENHFEPTYAELHRDLHLELANSRSYLEQVGAEAINDVFKNGGGEVGLHWRPKFKDVRKETGCCFWKKERLELDEVLRGTVTALEGKTKKLGMVPTHDVARNHVDIYGGRAVASELNHYIDRMAQDAEFIALLYNNNDFFQLLERETNKRFEEEVTKVFNQFKGKPNQNTFLLRVGYDHVISNSDLPRFSTNWIETKGGLALSLRWNDEVIPNTEGERLTKEKLSKFNVPTNMMKVGEYQSRNRNLLIDVWRSPKVEPSNIAKRMLGNTNINSNPLMYESNTSLKFGLKRKESFSMEMQYTE